jgi:hypothetical protein
MTSSTAAAATMPAITRGGWSTVRPVSAVPAICPSTVRPTSSGTVRTALPCSAASSGKNSS